MYLLGIHGCRSDDELEISSTSQNYAARQLHTDSLKYKVTYSSAADP